MADRLEDMLEPGETVLYRARGRWVQSAYFLALGLLPIGSALIIVLLAALLDGLMGTKTLPADPSAFATPLAGFVAIAAVFGAFAWYLYRRCRAAVLVTNRRLLYRPGMQHATVAEMPLGEITAIERCPDNTPASLAVTDRTGRTLALRPLHREARFTKALAAAAGLGVPERRGNANGLQALLELGERLVYRDTRRRLPRASIPEIVAVTCLMVMYWLALETSTIKSEAVVTATYFALLLIIIAVHYILETLQVRATRAMVTDRRMVYRAQGLFPEFKDLPLAEIAVVRCERAGPGGSVMVTTRQGRDMRFAHLGDPRAFARRLAEASGVGCPSFDSQLGWLNPLAFGLAGLALMVVLHILTVATFGTLEASTSDGSVAAAVVGLVLGFLAFGLAFTGGAYLGGLAALAALRRFATAEEMHAAILALKRGPAQPGSGEWHGKVLLMWQRLLDGRAPTPAGDGGTGHGG